jgi:hypothetical protein
MAPGRKCDNENEVDKINKQLRKIILLREIINFNES